MTNADIYGQLEQYVETFKDTLYLKYKLWIYKDKVYVIDFIYNDIKFAFDVLPEGKSYQLNILFRDIDSQIFFKTKYPQKNNLLGVFTSEELFDKIKNVVDEMVSATLEYFAKMSNSHFDTKNNSMETKNYTKKLLLCKSHAGLNDILCQIDKCLNYALKHDRELYIDGSRSGFLDSFENYFIAPKGVHLKDIDFLNPPFDIYPHCLSDNITTFKWKWDSAIKKDIHIPTNTVLSFDFDKSYPEQILVHAQAGGGDNSIYALEKFTLKENIRLHISKIIESLGEYDAIHVRHSDYKTDYEKFFSDINDKLGDKIVLCTDSYECQSYAKSLWKDKLQIVTNIPDTQGKRLHTNPNLDRFKTNLDALTDLFVLACGKNLYTTNITKGIMSGFGILANSLHKRKDLIEKLLWTKKAAVEMSDTIRVSSGKNSLSDDIMYFNNFVDNLCKREYLIDIAPLGKAKQSSLSKWSKPDDAQHAISMKRSNDFAFHTEKEEKPWWELTLDIPSFVEYIVIHNRKDACQERSRKLSVEVFDGEKYHQVYQGDLLFGSEPNGLPLILPVKYSKKIEKIKITLQANEYLHLSRVNVLISPPPTSSKKINVCILGTSNSVMKDGYVAGLSKAQYD